MSLNHLVDNDGLPADCEVCQGILQGFRVQMPGQYTKYLGLVRSIVDRDCPIHVPIIRDVLGSKLGTSDLNHAYAMRIEEQDALFLSIRTEDRRTARVDLRAVVDSEVSKSPMALGRRVDQQWLDPRLPKLWKAKCISEHGSHCSAPRGYFSDMKQYPNWVIDVYNNCLLPGRPGIKYICLSYVWGCFQGSKISKDAYSHMQCPGSLEAWDSMPLTVKHAMDVVKLLGEEYLWVDAFCIAQDDQEQAMHEIQNMAAIYAAAEVTIIAADGHDANAGLSGLPGISNHRTCVQRCFPFGNKLHLVEPIFSPLQHHPRTHYYSRGWTFQEYLFSKRRLIFEHNSLRWECSKCAWFEDMVEKDPPESQLKVSWIQDPLLESRYLEFHTYSRLVTGYSERQLTFDEDALPSFLGVTSQFSQTYHCSFLCGLPEAMLDIALLWGPFLGSHAPLLKRRVVSSHSACTSSLALLPSWSWIGWQGSIAWNAVVQDHVKQGPYNSPGHVVRTTSWSTSSSPSGQDAREIQVTDYRGGMIYVNSESPLPLGWSRHEQDPRLVKGESDSKGPMHPHHMPAPIGHDASCYFTHVYIPDIHFWYPIPLQLSFDKFVSYPQTQYLQCNTERAWLRYVPDEGTHKLTQMGMLVDDEGHKIGFITLQQAMDYDFMNTCHPIGSLLELAAISISVRPDATVYNVLWIEWRNHIAYRRALGEVSRDAWETQEREKFCLVLG